MGPSPTVCTGDLLVGREQHNKNKARWMICGIGASQEETTASDGDFPRSAKAGQDCNAAPTTQAGEEAREVKYTQAVATAADS